MDVTIDSDNIDRTFKALDKILEINSDKIRQDDLQAIGESVVAEVKSNLQTEQHIITGNLLSSIDIYELSSESVVVGSTEEYALYLEYGRGEVLPKNAKMLHWIDPNTGKDVYAKRSGPVEPTAFFERGVITGVNKAIQAISNKHTDEIGSVK